MELSVNLPTLAIQVINFLILLIALKSVLYEPMLKAIQEREQRVKKNLDDAEAVNRQALVLKQEYEDKIRDARQEVSSLVQQATQEGERLKGERVDEGRREAHLLVEKARQEVERERQEALGEVRGRVVDLSVQMATRLLRDSIEPDVQQRLVQQFVQKAEQMHVG